MVFTRRMQGFSPAIDKLGEQKNTEIWREFSVRCRAAAGV